MKAASQSAFASSTAHLDDLERGQQRLRLLCHLGGVARGGRVQHSQVKVGLSQSCVSWQTWRCVTMAGISALAPRSSKGIALSLLHATSADTSHAMQAGSRPRHVRQRNQDRATEPTRARFRRLAGHHVLSAAQHLPRFRKVAAPELDGAQPQQPVPRQQVGAAERLFGGFQAGPRVARCIVAAVLRALDDQYTRGTSGYCPLEGLAVDLRQHACRLSRIRGKCDGSQLQGSSTAGCSGVCIQCTNKTFHLHGHGTGCSPQPQEKQRWSLYQRRWSGKALQA